MHFRSCLLEVAKNGATLIKKIYIAYLKCLRSNRQRNGLFGLLRDRLATGCLLDVYWASIVVFRVARYVMLAINYSFKGHQICCHIFMSDRKIPVSKYYVHLIYPNHI